MEIPGYGVNETEPPARRVFLLSRVLARAEGSFLSIMDIFKARRAAFRKLHDNGCFVIPNPWDIGTARYLCHLGFQALATTSSGFASSRGMPDTGQGGPGI